LTAGPTPAADRKALPEAFIANEPIPMRARLAPVQAQLTRR